MSIIKASKDMPKALVSSVQERFIERFNQQKAPDGSTWKALKRGGIARLKKSGRLFNSIKHKAKNNEIQASSIDYAKYHHFGTRRLPARPIFGADETLLKKIAEVLDKLK